MARPELVLPQRFEAIRRIGAGGMGIVYEAMDVERGVRVAVKTVLHRDADALARFKHEFRALQDIHHPNLVALGELIAESDEVFFTMELVEGTDLLKWVRGTVRRGSPLDSPTALDLRPPEADTSIDLPTSVDRIPPSRSQQTATVPPSTSGTYDEARLRDAFRQIALGIAALHEAARVHRDVKPSNVRVTPEGRVVLLDFGLVLDSDNTNRSATELTVVGTPAYMAPEQASASPVGPEADWYAVGVMLYQCLTGRLPFEGAPLAVLMAKQYKEPLAPSAFVPGVPRDLDELCMALLRFEIKTRPAAREVLRVLKAQTPEAAPPLSGSQPGSAPFVGRAGELAALERAFEDARAGKAVTVALLGESGVGKSCLVKRFVETTLGRRSDALLLAGRCYEREAVPYKAFDEVMDTLSRRLARLPDDEALPLLPSRVEPLAQLFPALCRVPAIGRSSLAKELDPHEQRRRAFQALRDMLSRIAERQRLVITIDDLQWTDADSLSLLTEVMRPPDAPPLLLIVTMRSSPDAPDAERDVLAALPGDVRSVRVGRLEAPDARELAAILLRRASPDASGEASAIAAEAAGHPLFIDELVRHAAMRSSASSMHAPRLDDALRARTVKLDAPARRVLELVCVVGAPIAQEAVAHAAGLEMRGFARAVALLRTSNLVRTSGARVSDAIEPYHDRVREALVAGMTEQARREAHERIASALEVSKAFDPEVLATHWEGAGHAEKAAKYVLVAAEQAAQGLAFERAVRLYQRALDAVPATDPRRRILRRQLGDALANTGKGALAAAEYELAAQGANEVEALDLRRRAVEQLFRTGEVARGLAMTRAVLAGVGLSLPQTRLGAIVTLLWYRTLLLLRGLGYTPRDESDVPPTDLMRIDACWSVSFTLAYADAIAGAAFHARHIHLALRAGEIHRVARALAIETSYVGSRGSPSWARTQRLIERAHEAAERAGTPYARGFALATSGLAYCMVLRFADAAERLERAIAIFREHCPGSDWETTTSRFFLFVAYAYTCRFRELSQQLDEAVEDARGRGDRYTEVMLRVGVLNRIWLMTGNVARARRELDDAVQAWPATGFHVVHFHQLVAEGYLALYEGAPMRAYDGIKAIWPRLRGSLLLLMEPVKLEALGLRARAAIAAFDDPRCADREAALRDAEASLRAYGLGTTPINRATLLALRAGIAACRRREDEARALIERLAAGDGSQEMWLTSQCARWILGRMRGGIEGQAQARGAEVELTSRGVVPDQRLMQVMFPGFGRFL